MNLFRRQEAQPKQEPETYHDYAGEWTPAPLPAPPPDLSNYYEEQGMHSWYFYTPELVDEVRQAGYVCINDDTTLNHKEAAFWTDLKLEHGKPVRLPSGTVIILYGTMAATAEVWKGRVYGDDWFERNWHKETD